MFVSSRNYVYSASPLLLTPFTKKEHYPELVGIVVVPIGSFARRNTCKQIRPRFANNGLCKRWLELGNFDHEDFSSAVRSLRSRAYSFRIIKCKKFEIVKRGSEQELGYKRTVGGKRVFGLEEGGRASAKSIRIEIYICDQCSLVDF